MTGQVSAVRLAWADKCKRVEERSVAECEIDSPAFKFTFTFTSTLTHIHTHIHTHMHTRIHIHTHIQLVIKQVAVQYNLAYALLANVRGVRVAGM